VKITPARAGLDGRVRRPDEAASGTLNDLWAKALVLQDAGGKRVALVTLDVCGFDRQVSSSIRDRVERQHGLGRDAVAVCASHTHSGPGRRAQPAADLLVRARRGRQGPHVHHWLREPGRRRRRPGGVELAPATCGTASGSAGFAVNRRANKEADVAQRARPRAGGDVAGTAELAEARSRPGRPRPAGAGGDGRRRQAAGRRVRVRLPRDHARRVRLVRRLARVRGRGDRAAHPGATAMFVAGCGADQNPLPRRTVELAKAYGRRSPPAWRPPSRPRRARSPGPLATAYAEIDLPFGQLPTREQLEQQKASIDPKDRYLARRAGLLLERLEPRRQLPRATRTRCRPGGSARPARRSSCSAARSSSTTPCGSRRNSAAAHGVWPVGYANDVMAYVPSKRVLDEGGYEGGGAMVYYGLPASWGAEVEERIVAEVRRQVGVK
jgi:hypothetical protein